MDAHGCSATRAENTNAISSKSGLWCVLEPTVAVSMERDRKTTRTGHQSVTGPGGIQAGAGTLQPKLSKFAVSGLWITRVTAPKTTLDVQVLVVKAQVYKHLTAKLFYMCPDLCLA